MSIRRFFSQYKLYYVGLAVVITSGVAFICGAVVSEQERESERAKYGVILTPAKVSIGTRTSAYHPSTTTQPNTTVAPMISGNTVRSMAHGGHAASPARVSSGAVSSTAVGKVKTTTVSSGGNGGGGGGGGGGDATMYTSNRRRSNASAAGASVAVGSVPMPALAKVSRSYASEVGMGAASTAEETLSGKTIMSGKKDGSTPGDPGTPGEDPVWPPIPVGNTPWLMMMLLVAGYFSVKVIKKKSH